MKEEKSSDNPCEGREGRGRIFIHFVGKILHPRAQRVGQARKPRSVLLLVQGGRQTYLSSTNLVSEPSSSPITQIMVSKSHFQKRNCSFVEVVIKPQKLCPQDKNQLEEAPTFLRCYNLNKKRLTIVINLNTSNVLYILM